MKNETCAILFSGGTDSTLATALQLDHFQSVHLLTFERLGIASVENSKLNANMLIEKYGQDRVKHVIINIDKLFKKISYENYFSNIVKHGFMNLSTCGLCKLSMHIQTINYCHENNINYAADGANQGMKLFPAQMKPVVNQMKELYAKHDIDYSNPVFDFEYPDEGSFISMENSNMLTTLKPKEDEGVDKMTAGRVLYEKGLAPLPNVKGSDYDRKRQPRCFQFILFKTFVNKHYLSTKSYEEYVEDTVKFFDDKIKAGEKLIGIKKKEKV